PEDRRHSRGTGASTCASPLSTPCLSMSMGRPKCPESAGMGVTGLRRAGNSGDEAFGQFRHGRQVLVEVAGKERGSGVAGTSPTEPGLQLQRVPRWLQHAVVELVAPQLGTRRAEGAVRPG